MYIVYLLLYKNATPNLWLKTAAIIFPLTWQICATNKGSGGLWTIFYNSSSYVPLYLLLGLPHTRETVTKSDHLRRIRREKVHDIFITPSPKLHFILSIATVSSYWMQISKKAQQQRESLLLMGRQRISRRAFGMSNIVTSVFENTICTAQYTSYWLWHLHKLTVILSPSFSSLLVITILYLLQSFC